MIYDVLSDKNRIMRWYFFHTNLMNGDKWLRLFSKSSWDKPAIIRMKNWSKGVLEESTGIFQRQS